MTWRDVLSAENKIIYTECLTAKYIRENNTEKVQKSSLCSLSTILWFPHFLMIMNYTYNQKKVIKNEIECLPRFTLDK